VFSRTFDVEPRAAARRGECVSLTSTHRRESWCAPQWHDSGSSRSKSIAKSHRVRGIQQKTSRKFSGLSLFSSITKLNSPSLLFKEDELFSYVSDKVSEIKGSEYANIPSPLLTHIPSCVVSTDRYSLDDLLSKEVSWLYGVMQMIDTEYNEIDRRLPV